MVRLGEFLERMVIVRSRELALEGLYHRGRQSPACLVVPPHPSSGGSMDSPVVAELAWAVTRAGHPTLRFNYRGVGASAGRIGSEEDDVSDAEAALDQLRESCAGGALSLVGFGYGAQVALALSSRRADVAATILVSPDEAVLEARWQELPTRLLLLLPETRDPERLASLVARTPNARLERVPGADETFVRGLSQLGRKAAAFLAESAELRR